MPPGVRGILLLGVVCLNIACDRPGAKPQSPPVAAGAAERAGAAPVKQPSVASLSPAATDLLVGMGAADHLVAVSNFDADRGSIAALPRVGDYRTQDWEKLSALRPAKIIVQVHENRLPAGLRDRAQELGIELVNINIDDLPEVFEAIPKLGRAVGEEAKAQEAERALRKQFETLRKRVERAPRVSALVVVDDGGRSVAGPGTFLHDILIAAGGTNAAEETQSPWPTVDREKILRMSPQVVIHLLPNASPQVVAAARKFWAGLPQLPAVRDKRVHILTDWYVLLPGYHVGLLAEQFGLILHPFANIGPATAPATPPTDPPATPPSNTPPAGFGETPRSPAG